MTRSVNGINQLTNVINRLTNGNNLLIKCIHRLIDVRWIVRLVSVRPAGRKLVRRLPINGLVGQLAAHGPQVALPGRLPME